MPPHDGGRNFVGQSVGQHGGMPGTLARTLYDGFSNFANQTSIVEKSIMPLRLQPDEDSQAMAVRLVEKPARRRRISPNSVDAVRGHCGEVPLDGLRRRKPMAIRIRPEGSVSHPANVNLFFANPKKFAADGYGAKI